MKILKAGKKIRHYYLYGKCRECDCEFSCRDDETFGAIDAQCSCPNCQENVYVYSRKITAGIK